MKDFYYLFACASNVLIKSVFILFLRYIIADSDRSCIHYAASFAFHCSNLSLCRITHVMPSSLQSFSSRLQLQLTNSSRHATSGTFGFFFSCASGGRISRRREADTPPPFDFLTTLSCVYRERIADLHGAFDPGRVYACFQLYCVFFLSFPFFSR